LKVIIIIKEFYSALHSTTILVLWRWSKPMIELREWGQLNRCSGMLASLHWVWLDLIILCFVLCLFTTLSIKKKN